VKLLGIILGRLLAAIAVLLVLSPFIAAFFGFLFAMSIAADLQEAHQWRALIWFVCLVIIVCDWVVMALDKYYTRVDAWLSGE